MLMILLLELNVLLTYIIHEIRSERSFIILMQVLSTVSFSSEPRILVSVPTIQFTTVMVRHVIRAGWVGIRPKAVRPFDFRLEAA